MRDLRHGLRRVVAAPGFAAIAVLTLALGIGANVAIFTVVNAVLIRPLPFPNPDRLVRIAADARATNGRNIGISQPELDDLSNRAGVFEGVTAVWPVSASMLGGERPERVEVLATSANYFQLLGASAEITWPITNSAITPTSASLRGSRPTATTSSGPPSATLSA